ncbi:MAG: competence/damage-inducible protein A [Lachnospiraceae bacterium]|nr:competence/damage-inducible protein A [Lachnospiraceae bacterium]
MTVEILCVGTELLLGNIVNTNAAYLAEKCASLGLSCYYQSVVGDNEGRLKEAISTAMGRSDVVILSGGLGPTEDDLTKETAAAVMGKKLVMDEESKDAITAYFKKRGIQATDNNWKQALVPEGALVLTNHNGTAPGIIMRKDNTHVVLLPGPPGELKPMFEENVVPYLEALEPGIIYSQTVKICGVGESKAETMLKDLIDTQTNPTIATYAKPGEVHIRVTAKADNEKEAKKLNKPVIKELKSRFGYDIYTTEEDVTLEKAVVDLMLANELSFTCAESCTGGMLSARLINVPGASECYKCGFITYSNKAKRKVLGVKKPTLQKYGAVSEQVAEEMANGAANAYKADMAIAITGIAGPDGGSKEKPVGLVYIACYMKGKVTVQKFQFMGNREKIRESAVTSALNLMRKCILEYFSKVTFGKK